MTYIYIWLVNEICNICVYYRDGRLKAGDELLMINGQSLVGLSHQDAVAVLRSTSGLVQLVVASRVLLMNLHTDTHFSPNMTLNCQTFLSPSLKPLNKM